MGGQVVITFQMESTLLLNVVDVKHDGFAANKEQVMSLTPVVTIIYFSILLGIILVTICLSYRTNLRRLTLEEKKHIVMQYDRPPSYTMIVFPDDPPPYSDLAEAEGLMKDEDYIPLIDLETKAPHIFLPFSP